MPRIFVHHDKAGKILSVASVEAMHDDLAHPFAIEDQEHGVIETAPDDPALARGLEHAHGNFRVDPASKRLIALAESGTESQPVAGRRKRSST